MLLACRMLLLVWILVFSSSALQSQGPGRLPLRTHGVRQGMDSDVITALVQDAQGLVWAGTEAGLHFYNGRTFEPHVHSGELPSQMIHGLLPDSDGGLWISTQGGLARLYHGLTKTIGPEHGIPRGWTKTLGRDAQNRLWVLTTGGLRMESGHQTFSPVPGPPAAGNPSLLFVHASLPGAWVIADQHLWWWDPVQAGWQALPTPPLERDETFIGLAVDGTGTTWLRTPRQLWRRPAEGAWQLRRGDLKGSSEQLRLERDSQGWVWFDDPKGLWRVRGEQMELFVPRAKTDRGSLEIRCSLVDRDGGIWLATRLGVWQVLGGMGWRAYGTAEGLPSQTIWAATRDPEGQLWVSTEEGLCVSQGDGWKRILPTRMFNMVVSRDGALWTAGSPGGTVFQINLPTLGVQRHKVDVLPPGGILTSLTLDEEGRPWVADSRAGLARGRQEGSRWIWERVLLDGKEFRDVRNLFTDADGRVMVVHVGGVAIWHRGRWSQLEGVLDALPLNLVFDGRGQLLVSYLNRPVLTRYQLLDGSYHSVEQLEPFAHRAQTTIYSMGFEARGRLWMGTSKGAVRLELGRPESLRIFGTDDGIIFTDCNQNALFVDKDRVWIGTSQGLASYRTDLPEAPTLLRAPVLLSAQTNGKALPMDAPVMVLPQDSRNLDLHFLVPTYFRAQGGITYQSRMTGVDSGWVSLDQPRLRYPSLHPGRYLLEIRGRLEDGQAGPSLVVRFEVLPRWWESRLAWTCYVLLGGGAVFGLARLRQAQLETRNRELREEVARQTEVAHLASQAKSAFLAHMSHELRTPLSAILLYSELLQEDASEHGLMKIQNDATKIHGAGRHLLDLIDGILDLSKIEAGHMTVEVATVALRPFLADLVTTLEPVVTKNGNRFEAHLDRAPAQIKTDAVRLRQVLSNLLGNAAKFTRDGQVSLQVEAAGSTVQFTVSDTGIGMSQEALARVFDEFVQADTSTTRKYGGTGLGLSLVRRFSELLGGRVEVHSQLGVGTSFFVILPIDGPSALA